MNSPTNVKELVTHLHVSPRVRCGDRLLVFLEHKGGGLWFLDQNGSNVYLPINCGMVSAETGLEFFEDRFEVTKFGVTLTFFYESP